MNSVLIQPIISEKSMKHAANSKFTFAVLKSANKGTIKNAVEKQFNVHVASVSTAVVKGRTNRTGMKRVEVQLAPWKKAIVQLKNGEKIDLFDVTG